MIQDMRDLKALFKLCRAQGITDFEMNGIKIKFGAIPQDQSNNIGMADVADEESVNRYGNFPQGELTPEQLMYYSAGGRPDEDPVLKKAGNE